MPRETRVQHIDAEHTVPSVSGEIKVSSVQKEHEYSSAPTTSRNIKTKGRKRYQLKLGKPKRKKLGGTASKLKNKVADLKWKRWRAKCDRHYDAKMRKSDRDRKRLEEENRSLLSFNDNFCKAVDELTRDTRHIRRVLEERHTYIAIVSALFGGQ